MIETKKLTPEVSVCAQPSVKDIALLHTLGFKSIVCNRPDGEAIDQSLYSEIAQTCAYAGLKTAYLPISADGPTAKDTAHMAELLKSLPPPVLAYCKSGARSEALVNTVTAKA